jgi:hypothetical protein
MESINVSFEDPHGIWGLFAKGEPPPNGAPDKPSGEPPPNGGPDAPKGEPPPDGDERGW